MSSHLDLEQETVRRLTEHCRMGRVDLALLVILQAIHLSERKIMTAISDALATATANDAALAAEVGTLTAKVDALIALAQAGGASQADIDAALALAASTAASTAALQAEEGKVDAALAPPPAPSAS